MTANLRDMLPRDKHDIERARAIVELGYPAVHPILPDLLVWIQDMNWPVAQVLQPFLAQVGKPLAPYLREILQSDDDVWKGWVVVGLIAHSGDLTRALENELTRLANEPTAGECAEEVHLAAGEALQSRFAKKH